MRQAARPNSPTTAPAVTPAGNPLPPASPPTVLTLAKKAATWGVSQGISIGSWSFQHSIITGKYFLKHCLAAPSLLSTLLFHGASRRLMINTGKMLARDFIPLFFLAVISAYLGQMTDSIPYISLPIIYAAQLFLLYIQLRQFISILERSSILAVQHEETFNIPTTPAKPGQVNLAIVPRDNQSLRCTSCTDMRVFKGEIRSLVAYYVQLIMAAIAGRILGTTAQLFLTCLINGQLFVEYRLGKDGVCDRHRTIFYSNHSEYCFALGLLMQTCSYLTSLPFTFLLTSQDATAHLLGASADSRFASISQALVTISIQATLAIYFIGLAYHSPLPTNQKMPQRWPDPVTLSRRLVAWAVDFITPETKRRAKAQLRATNKSSAFKKAKSTIETLRHHPISHAISILLPRNLSSIENFRHDPVIKDYMDDLRQRGLAIITEIKHTQTTTGVKAIKKLPKKVGKWLLMWSENYPPIISELIVSALQSRDFSQLIDELEVWLKKEDVATEQITRIFDSDGEEMADNEAARRHLRRAIERAMATDLPTIPPAPRRAHPARQPIRQPTTTIRQRRHSQHSVRLLEAPIQINDDHFCTAATSTRAATTAEPSQEAELSAEEHEARYNPFYGE